MKKNTVKQLKICYLLNHTKVAKSTDFTLKKATIRSKRYEQFKMFTDNLQAVGKSPQNHEVTGRIIVPFVISVI